MKVLWLSTLVVLLVLPSTTLGGWRNLVSGITDLFSWDSQSIVDKIKNFLVDNASDHKICTLCNFVVNIVMTRRKLGMSRERLAEEAKFVCVSLGVESERVCNGVVDLNIDVFLYILDNYSGLRSERICGLIFQKQKCSVDFDWSIKLPKGTSQVRNESFCKTTKNFKVLLISDIHYDPNYKQNKTSNCGEYLCCQNDQKDAVDNGTSCGYWTDYHKADAPWHLIEETIRQVKTQDFKYVYFTGDVVSHRIWDTSITNNSKDISKFYSYLKKSFKVPVYPIFGNHEPHPLNLWPPLNINDENLSIDWLFHLAAKHWSLLIGEDVSKTVLKGGYYTVSPRPGFRIIALNSNVCFNLNFWLIYDDEDPYGQLQWLADTLEKAEKNNESVHILSHVPTGTSECFWVWAREYARIVDRFANTITGQFNGHTHYNEFHVYYNKTNLTEPLGVAFNGASITPFSLSNPSYKIFDVDARSFSLRNYEEWTFNLTEANLSRRKPKWYKLYSFLEAFGVDSLKPVEVDKVLQNMARNHSILNNYHKFKYRNGDIAIKNGCDELCQQENLCDTATTVFGESQHCGRLLTLYKKGK